MNDSSPRDASDPAQPPAEHPTPSQPKPKPEPPSTRYRATLRLIGFRQVDEARSKPKRRWPWKRK